jgi:anti-sigma28 factor (negative regulator of flagellin synthesis)
MNIEGVEPTIPPVAPQAVTPVAQVPPQAEAVVQADTVEISAVARLAAKVHELPDIRADVVERVKAEIAAGTYENDERIDVAVDRILDELTG